MYFDLDIEGRRHPNLSADVRQPLGPGAEEDFLQVTEPHGYTGPINLPVFQGLVEFYYRHVIGAQGLMLGMGTTDMRFVGYVLEQPRELIVDRCPDWHRRCLSPDLTDCAPL